MADVTTDVIIRILYEAWERIRLRNSKITEANFGECTIADAIKGLRRRSMGKKIKAFRWVFRIVEELSEEELAFKGDGDDKVMDWILESDDRTVKDLADAVIAQLV